MSCASLIRTVNYFFRFKIIYSSYCNLHVPIQMPEQCFCFFNASRLLEKEKSKSSRLNKKLALQKFCFSFVHGCCNTMTGSVKQQKSVGFTFSCFLGVPILGSELCLSPLCFGSGFARGLFSCSPPAGEVSPGICQAMGCPAARQGLMAPHLLGLSPQQAPLSNFYFHSLLILEHLN